MPEQRQLTKEERDQLALQQFALQMRRAGAATVTPAARFVQPFVESVTLGRLTPRQMELYPERFHGVVPTAGRVTGGLVPVLAATTIGGGAAGAAARAAGAGARTVRVAQGAGRVVAMGGLGAARPAESAAERLQNIVQEAAFGLGFEFLHGAPRVARGTILGTGAAGTAIASGAPLEEAITEAGIMAGFGLLGPRSTQEPPPPTAEGRGGLRRVAPAQPTTADILTTRAAGRRALARTPSPSGEQILGLRAQGVAPLEARPSQLRPIDPRLTEEARTRELRRPPEIEEPRVISEVPTELPAETPTPLERADLVRLGQTEWEGGLQGRAGLQTVRLRPRVTRAAEELPTGWREVEPSEVLPIGSSVRMDVTTGRNITDAPRRIRAESIGRETEAAGAEARAPGQGAGRLRVRDAEEQVRLEARPRTEAGAPGETGSVQSLKINELIADPERMQGRTKAFSKDTVRDIVANYNEAKFDPIQYWIDPKTGQRIILSGHSRYEAAQRLGLERIKAIEVRNPDNTPLSEAQARQYARNEANRLATPETLGETVRAYRESTEAGISKSELGRRFGRQGRSITRLENYTELNPKGEWMRALEQPEDARQHFKGVEQIASWVGEARRRWPDKFTNRHETEVFRYFYEEGAKSERRWLMKKEDFLGRVSRRLDDLMFNPEETLNLDRIELTTGGRARADTAKAYAEIERLQGEINRIQKNQKLAIETRREAVSQLEQEIQSIRRGIEGASAQGSLLDVFGERGGIRADQREPIDRLLRRMGPQLNEVDTGRLERAVRETRIVRQGQERVWLEHLPQTLRDGARSRKIAVTDLPRLMMDYVRNGLQSASQKVRSFVQRAWEWFDRNVLSRVDWQAMARGQRLGSLGGGFTPIKLKPRTGPATGAELRSVERTRIRLGYSIAEANRLAREMGIKGGIDQLGSNQVRDFIGEMRRYEREVRNPPNRVAQEIVKKWKGRFRDNEIRKLAREAGLIKESRRELTEETGAKLDKLLQGEHERREALKELFQRHVGAGRVVSPKEVHDIALLSGLIKNSLRELSPEQIGQLDRVLTESAKGRSPRSAPKSFQEEFVQKAESVYRTGQRVLGRSQHELDQVPTGRRAVERIGRFERNKKIYRGEGTARWEDLLLDTQIGSLRSYLTSPELRNTLKWMRTNGKHYIEQRGNLKVEAGVDRSLLEKVRLTWKDIAEYYAEQAERIDVEGFERISDQIDYFPHWLTRDIRVAIERGSGDVYDALREQVRIRGEWRSRQHFDDFWRDFTGNVKQKRFGSIENPRLLDLPETIEVNGKTVNVLETNPLEMIAQFIPAASRRLAFIEEFGQGTKQLNAFKRQVWREATDKGLNAGNMDRLLQLVFEEVQGISRYRPFTGPGAEVFNQTIAAIRTGQLSLAAIPNITAGWVPIATRFGLTDTLYHMLRAATKPEAYRWLREIGASMHDVTLELYELADLSNVKWSRKALTYLGFNGANRWLNRIAGGASVDHFTKVVARGDLRAMRTLVKDFHFSERDLARLLRTRELTPMDRAQIAQRAIALTNISGESALDRRPWMNSTWARYALSYTAYVRKLGESLAYSVDQARQGNVEPLAIHIFGTVGAAHATIALKDWLRGKERQDEGIWARLYLDLLYAGSLGPIGELMQRFHYAAKFGENPMTGIGGPQLEMFGELIIDLLGPAMRGESVNVARIARKTAPIVAVGENVVRQIR